MWYVPTGEILPAKRWSFSFYRTNWDREAGFTDITHTPITFGYGINDRVELFGSVRAVTRIDRDIRPLFIPGNNAGGFVNDNPNSYRQGWSDNQFGDIMIGGKFNITAEHRQQPVAFAIRGLVKLPTGDKDTGAGTGKADFGVDAIISKELNQAVELSGYAGGYFRTDPDDVRHLPQLQKYGVGAGFPTRTPLRITAELVGEKYSTTPSPARSIGTDATRSGTRARIDAILGITFIAPKGFFIGGGASYALKHDNREQLRLAYGDETGDKVGWQLRIGYHPGVKIYAPPPPPPPPPPPAPQNRPPTVKARCEPCIVEVGKSSTVTGDGQDPDGDSARPTSGLARRAASRIRPTVRRCGPRRCRKAPCR